MEQQPVNLERESREALEERLMKARQQLSDMELDLENGRYKGGIPQEYYDEINHLKEELIPRLEDELRARDKDSNSSETTN